jgi:hypothetical protein
VASRQTLYTQNTACKSVKEPMFLHLCPLSLLSKCTVKRLKTLAETHTDTHFLEKPVYFPTLSASSYFVSFPHLISTNIFIFNCPLLTNISIITQKTEPYVIFTISLSLDLQIFKRSKLTITHFIFLYKFKSPLHQTLISFL